MVYWSVKSRGLAIAAVAAMGKVDFKWNSDTANTWPAPKEKSPMGQLPFLQDGDVLIGQSMACLRYVARAGGLQGDDNADFGTNETILEEYAEIFNKISADQYAPSRKEAFDKTFSEYMPKHLGNLEKNLKDNKFSSKILSGEVAVAVLLYVLLELQPDCLDAFPKLKAFYEYMCTIDELKPYVGSECKVHPYFKRT